MSRHIALTSLNSAGDAPGQTERRLETLFKKNPHLSERDRAFAVNLVQGVLRWRIRLDWILRQFVRFPFEKIDSETLNILRLALYQILFLDRVPDSAAVNEAVKQVKRIRGKHVIRFVNGVLRQICRKKTDLPYPQKKSELHLSVYYAYPLWLVKKWTRELGADTTLELLKAGNQLPRLTIRANRLKNSRNALLERFKEEGIDARMLPFAPEGIELPGFRGSVSRLETFKEGLFQVQGEAAQICGHLLAPQKGTLVADLCAGLGGKSTHMAELMGNQGEIIALDDSVPRLKGLMENSKRLGITTIFPVAGDAASSPPFLHNAAGKIMVDAPCSGLGVISKHPDTKLFKKEDDIKRLAMIQESILLRSCDLLKPHGEMLYVTCTISRNENERVVESLLRKNNKMVLQDLRLRMPAWGLDLVNDNGFLQTYPHVHGMDGFFAALFKRRSS